MKWLVSLLGGGIPAELRAAYQAKLNAANAIERLEADKLVAQIEAARQIAAIEAHDRFSATRIGRLLIVVPYGVWWASAIAVSTLGVGDVYIVQDLPPRIHDMAQMLIPAILIGSVFEGYQKAKAGRA